ncbi:hypothetical protein [Myxococcus sp. RHSTA-1-4]|uniref:hypothetical protein n=1 Tax=Myxococcus sp. RHSTA-1-4 TaxID=2874601 RepID=UPI001CC01C14|nr:hypothetical protein [Myxococcus sp. RHSTA-1-4]
MLVYGDHPREVDAVAEARALVTTRAEVRALPPGLSRHAALVSLLIRVGEWAQGVLDAEHQRRGGDGDTPLARACEAALLALGHAVAASWSDGFRADLETLGPLLEVLEGLAPREPVRCKVPEGYAFYALYPEAYLEAARAVPADGRPWRVIGIRGIGTGLAGVVAAGLGTEVLCTVRPGGHPFERTLSLSPERAARLAEEARAGWRFAVVDEGPGLSGSSFGAVADFLESHGAAPESVTFFPSHAGDLGPQAQARHRERWARAGKCVVDFEPLLLRLAEPSHALARWVEDLTGQAEAPLEDVGGGGWRRLLLPEAEWPPVHLWQERRKYVSRAGGRRWLLKFAGLGAHGARACLHARALAEAGFGVPVAGLRHGFLVQPWLEEARPLSMASSGVERQALVERVGAYLGFRSHHFGPVGDECGASPRELWEMARYNTEAALGREVASALEAWEPRLDGLAREIRRTVTDNRMHAWEWLVLPGGRVLKADGVDHHRGHDLVGCQDLAWDLAGAAVELSLDADALGALCTAVECHKGHVPSPGVLRFHRHAYLAFQLGHHALAAASYDTRAPDEAARLRRAADRYAALLRSELAAFSASVRAR